ncbi:hypothetical protein D3C77_784270 [compost metagenome]
MARGLAVGVGVALLVVHRAELEHLDQPVVVAVALLLEEHRPARVDLDRQRDQQHHRRGGQQGDAGQHEVFQALEQR